MNIFDKLKENNIRFYFNIEELSSYEINTIITNIKLITEYYKNKSKIETVDDYFDYIFLQHILNINEVQEEDIVDEYKELFTDASNQIEQLRHKYKIEEVIAFVSEHYKDVFEYLSNNKINYRKLEIKEDFIIKINKYLSSTPKHREIVEYLLENDLILVFDNIYLLSKYKKELLGKLAIKDKLSELITFRYNKVLKFLRENNKGFRETEEYETIIKILIDNILDEKQPIYKREKECSKLISFLKEIKDARVRVLIRLHTTLKRQLDKEVKKNGTPIGFKLEFKDAILEYKKYFNEIYENDFVRLLAINTIIEDNKNEEGEKKHVLTIENVDKTEIGLTAALFGEDYYYASVRIMQVQSYISIFNRFFYSITVKKMGYRRLEKLLNHVISDIFNALQIEYEEQERKNDIKGVIYAIKVAYNKYSSNVERNHNYYINAFYIISYIEKILRKIYIAINEEHMYIPEDKYTLAQFLREEENEKLQVIVGKNLFKWTRYFLCNIIHETNSGTKKELGHNYRNLMGHYRDLQTVNVESIAIYNIVIYLFINLIEALHLNIIDYPCEETEKIVEKQILKDDSFKEYIESKISLQGLI